jgi:quercetin dioxygenase-like cupin family protein
MKLCVTGHDDRGKAVFSYVGTPPRELNPGSYDLWSTRGTIRVPDDADPKAPSSIGYFPTLGETSFKLASVPPPRDGEQQIEFSEAIAGFMEADDPGMHTTDTIDYVLIVSGEADLELDDGRRERVAAGDCVVQRGTRHAWRVVGDQPLVLCAVLIGAERRG